MKKFFFFKTVKKLWPFFILSTIIYFFHFYITGIKLNQSLISLFTNYHAQSALVPALKKLGLYILLGTLSYPIPILILSFLLPNLEGNLKLHYFSKIKKYPENFFNAYTVTQISQSIQNLGLSVKEVTSSFFNISGSACCIILGLYQGLITHWMFFALYIFYISITSFVYFVFYNKISSINKQSIIKSKSFLHEIIDIISNNNILCFFNSYNIKNEKINKCQMEERESYKNSLLVTFLSESIYSINISLILQVLLIFISLFLLKKNQINLTQILMLIRMNGFVIGRVSYISKNITQINTSLSMLEESLDVLDSHAEQVTENHKYGNTLLGFTGDIEIKNLTFSYQGKMLFYKVNLRIKPGDRVCIIGASGTGKTTLLKLLIRAIEPPAGTIFIDGHDVLTLDSLWLKHQIGFVLQNNTLFHDTVFNNIKLYRDIPDQNVIEAAMSANIHDFIMEKPMGYDTIIDPNNSKSTFSGGQLQRICIARSISHRPSMIIGDELTSALDDRTANEVIDNLIQNSKNKTMIFVTHNKAILPKFNKIFCISNGVITNYK